MHNASLRVSKGIAVCALHWPPHFEEIKIKSKSLPEYPPSILPCVPPSLVPTS